MVPSCASDLLRMGNSSSSQPLDGDGEWFLFFGASIEYLRLCRQYLASLDGHYSQYRSGPASGREHFNAIEVGHPLVFNLIHSLELLLKAWCRFTEQNSTPTHDVDALYDEFKRSAEGSWSELIEPLAKIEAAVRCLPGPLAGQSDQFSKIPMDPQHWGDASFNRWYQFCRYPVLTTRQAKENAGHSVVDGYVFTLGSNASWEQLHMSVDALWRATAKLYALWPSVSTES